MPMRTDIETDIPRTYPPTADEYHRVAVALADRAVAVQVPAEGLHELLEMIGYIGPVGSGAPVESSRVPEPPKRRNLAAEAPTAPKGTHCRNEHKRTSENTQRCSDGGWRCLDCIAAYIPIRTRRRAEAAGRVYHGHRDKVCRNGHKRTAQNTKIRKRKRVCLDCEADRQQRKASA